MTGIDASMFELFREEVKAHADALAANLVAADAASPDPAVLEELMRAAHSIKGAARIVDIDTAVRLAHVMEDAFVAAQSGKSRLAPADIDVLLRGTDVLAGLAALTQDTIAAWEANNVAAVTALEPLVVAIAEGRREEPTPPAPLPEGKGEKEPSHAPNVNRAPAANESDSPLPSGRGAGGVGSSPFPPVPAFEAPPVPAEPFALAPDHSMLDLFREETREHLSYIANALAHLGADPTAAEPVAERLKQLRGAARLVKCAAVADAAGALGAYLRTAPTLDPLARDWTRYAVATLAGVLATDDETYPTWVETARPALAAVTDAFTRAASRPIPPCPPSTDKGKGEKEVPAPAAIVPSPAIALHRELRCLMISSHPLPR